MANTPRGKNQTLERIAELAGVSRSTVSRVMNNDPNVADATRASVLDVVARERFVPNRSARGLASGRTGVIGIVIAADLANLFADPYFAVLLQAIYDAARADGLVLSLWLPDDGDPSTIDQIARGSTLDGVLIAAEAADDPIVLELVKTEKPTVLIGRSEENDRISYVDVDNRAAARTATEHLIDLGRSRIATITGPAHSVASGDRLAGYKDALAEAGLAVDDALIIAGDFSAASGAAATTRLLDQQPDAIVAANDVMAVAALTELEAAGRRTPDDVAVIGFDDLPIAANAEPALSTMCQPIRAVASEAVSVLTQLIGDETSVPVRKSLSAELVVRASCGAEAAAQLDV